MKTKFYGYTIGVLIVGFGLGGFAYNCIHETVRESIVILFVATAVFQCIGAVGFDVYKACAKHKED